MSILLLGLDPSAFSDDQLDQIRTTAPDNLRIAHSTDREEIGPMLDEIEVIVGSFPRDLLTECAQLRWMQQWSAGADWLMDYPDVQKMDFTLTNASGVHAVPISEHIFAFLLAFARHIPQAVRAQQNHIWIANGKQSDGASGPSDERLSTLTDQDMLELADKTLLLLGVGAIGERTAKIADVFDMHVIGVRHSPEKSVPHVAQMVGNDELLRVLPQADFVVITLPLTPETRGLFDAEKIGAMKESAYLINIGRGEIVDEEALVQALQQEKIAGAGLDVFQQEPLPEESPLWAMENVIVTSHYAGLTPRYDERAFNIFIDNLRRYREGEELRNVVDKEMGY